MNIHKHTKLQAGYMGGIKRHHKERKRSNQLANSIANARAGKIYNNNFKIMHKI